MLEWNLSSTWLNLTNKAQIDHRDDDSNVAMAQATGDELMA